MQFVVVDLETTGLDAKVDSIIEVALLRMDDTGKVLEEWSSLVNPGFVIKEDITFITNIRPEDLKDAPAFSQIQSKIVEFIGEDPIVGHNVQFDIGFLREYGIKLTTQVFDTFKIAEFLYYGEKSLSLSSITEELGYTHTNAHRAYADVLATAFLFAKLMERIRSLDSVQSDILRSISQRTPESWVLAYLARQAPDTAHGKIFTEEVLSRRPELPEKPSKSSPSEMSLAQDGLKTIPTWEEVLEHASSLEERPEQRKMIEMVHASLS